jgi:antitoxin (DNA-binding transcriptional repressor) of toxin-antitoxin stability system
LLVMAIAGLAGASASAATLHPIGNFDQPIFVTSNPADPEDLFVVEREGRVVRLDGAASSLYADVSNLVECCKSERGMLSIALSPDFDASGRFYAAYTGTAAAGGAIGDLHVDAFRHDGANLVREPLLTVAHALNPTHNGGQLQFGPDGNLYVSTGDGGGAGDPLGSGQDPESLLGKILRLEPQPGVDPQIWSLGLRNPWRFSFDRLSGDMVIADVGQDIREEIDVAASPAPGVVGGGGTNYGWNCREGFIAYAGAPESCDGLSGFTDPVFDYPHADPENGTAHGCSITGGYVVRDTSLDDLYGRYVYADFCVGEIRSLLLPAAAGGTASEDRSEGLSVVNPVSFGEDSCGRLYVAAKAGSVYRLEGSAPAACRATSVSPTGPPSATPISLKRPKPVRLRLGAKVDRVRAGLELTLTARAVPCADNVGRAVRLNRGGKPNGRKRLNRNCAARFHRRISHQSTFRALLPSAAVDDPTRSRRVVVSAG